jgi:hypothetical protein
VSSGTVFVGGGKGLKRFASSKEVAHDAVEPLGLIPLHPVGAVVEEVKFGVRDQLKKKQAPLDRHAAVLVASEKKAFHF